MKCANCEQEELSPNAYKFGELFISELIQSEYDPGGIVRDASVTQHYSGSTISWFICNNCEKKGHDWSGVKLIAFLIPAGIISYNMAPGLLIFVGIGFLAGLSALAYWFKDSKFKALYCRDNILQKCFYNLILRDDFIARYGSIGRPDKTETRFQRGLI